MTRPVPSSHAPALLRISSANLAANYKTIRGMASSSVAGVIKANGYGTGLEHALETLWTGGCRQFFVATPEEASLARSLQSSADIFVLGGFYHDAGKYYAAHNIIPVLGSLEEIERWSSLARKTGHKLSAAIHFDAGMNRLGLGKDETKKLIDGKNILDGIDLKLVMSHFACSDEKDHEMNQRQADIFAKITDAFPHTPKSLCNSSGIFRSKDWHHDLLRPGVALYGGNPTPETKNPMLPVVSLDVRILQTRNVKKGESAGYGATHTFASDTRTATVALGYADGIPRGGSNSAKLFWNGQPCSVAGRISMDLTIVDIGGVSGPPPQAGDLLEILGPHQSVDDLAAACGTIGYEILTSLGKRYERVYL